MEESQKEDWKKMIPNPGVGVPYIYAYAKFNQELKKLEELKTEGKTGKAKQTRAGLE